MARGLKPHCFPVFALFLSFLLLWISASQARTLCDPIDHHHVTAPPAGLSQEGSAHYYVDILGLWGIKTTGPSAPGEGH
ncbi:hypothetical protein FNV43_RR14376 [Rhamnella rubrinervis]|uniref:Uncharacterized protein n=1 Tax=Rhamnella rubrinervis TaxID=2594499 RepID=A0A8K0MGD2_9ROSA|nr:hypothetical protein FNV43_RR14376 [Rhamnella rubrinervis]